MRITGKDFLKPLFSADVHGAGTRDEPLAASIWEASSLVQSYSLPVVNNRELIRSFVGFLTNYR